MGDSEVALRQENFIQSNEIARLNVRICDLVKVNKKYEDEVKELEKNASKWEERKAELDSFVQSLDAAKKKMNAEKVSKSLELSSTKVELELAKRQVLSLNINKAIKGLRTKQGSLFFPKIEFFINANIRGWNFL